MTSREPAGDFALALRVEKGPTPKGAEPWGRAALLPTCSRGSLVICSCRSDVLSRRGRQSRLTDVLELFGAGEDHEQVSKFSERVFDKWQGHPARETLWHRHPADDPWAGRGPPTRNSALGTPSPCHDESPLQTPSESVIGSSLLGVRRSRLACFGAAVSGQPNNRQADLGQCGCQMRPGRVRGQLADGLGGG